MAGLSDAEKEAIKKRRGFVCDADKQKHRSSNLEVHHKDRNPKHNEPENLRVLCIKHHDKLHSRGG